MSNTSPTPPVKPPTKPLPSLTGAVAIPGSSASAPPKKKNALPPVVRVDISGYGVVKAFQVQPQTTFSDLCAKVIDTYPTKEPDFPSYRIFLIETAEDEGTVYHIPVQQNLRVMNFLRKWGVDTIHTLLFKKPATIVLRVVFHDGSWKTFACDETETIGQLRKRVMEKRLPNEDDHVNCRLHEHIKDGDKEEVEVVVDDKLFVSELVQRWPSDPRERETHNFVYKVPSKVARATIIQSQAQQQQQQQQQQLSQQTRPNKGLPLPPSVMEAAQQQQNSAPQKPLPSVPVLHNVQQSFASVVSATLTALHINSTLAQTAKDDDDEPEPEPQPIRRVVPGSRFHKALIMEAVMRRGQLRPVAITRMKKTEELEQDTDADDSEETDSTTDESQSQPQQSTIQQQSQLTQQVSSPKLRPQPPQKGTPPPPPPSTSTSSSTLRTTLPIKPLPPPKPNTSTSSLINNTNNSNNVNKPLPPPAKPGTRPLPLPRATNAKQVTASQMATPAKRASVYSPAFAPNFLNQVNQSSQSSSSSQKPIMTLPSSSTPLPATNSANRPTLPSVTQTTAKPPSVPPSTNTNKQQATQAQKPLQLPPPPQLPTQQQLSVQQPQQQSSFQQAQKQPSQQQIQPTPPPPPPQQQQQQQQQQTTGWQPLKPENKQVHDASTPKQRRFLGASRNYGQTLDLTSQETSDDQPPSLKPVQVEDNTAQQQAPQQQQQIIPQQQQPYTQQQLQQQYLQMQAQQKAIMQAQQLQTPQNNLSPQQQQQMIQMQYLQQQQQPQMASPSQQQQPQMTSPSQQQMQMQYAQLMKTQQQQPQMTPPQQMVQMQALQSNQQMTPQQQQMMQMQYMQMQAQQQALMKAQQQQQPIQTTPNNPQQQQQQQMMMPQQQQQMMTPQQQQQYMQMMQMQYAQMQAAMMQGMTPQQIQMIQQQQQQMQYMQMMQKAQQQQQQQQQQSQMITPQMLPQQQQPQQPHQIQPQMLPLPQNTQSSRPKSTGPGTRHQPQPHSSSSSSPPSSQQQQHQSILIQAQMDIQESLNQPLPPQQQRNQQPIQTGTETQIQELNDAIQAAASEDPLTNIPQQEENKIAVVVSSNMSGQLELSISATAKISDLRDLMARQLNTIGFTHDPSQYQLSATTDGSEVNAIPLEDSTGVGDALNLFFGSETCDDSHFFVYKNV